MCPQVYIHGIKRPTGVWWQRLKATQRVLHVRREYPEHSVDRATMTQELALGIMRVAILLKYGGVYCDSHVIWTNSIPEQLFKYDAVASPGWHQLGAWPDSVSHAVVLAKKNSEYLLKLRTLHAHNRKKRFWFVDQFLSYKLVEQQPDLMFLDRHLQVTCLNQNCHPTWRPNYKIPFRENPPGPAFSWQNETLSVVWDVFPPLELDAVKYTSGPVVDASRAVLHKAGITLQELTAV
ncbi:hypothetical protein ElyMa_001002500 [Elysia marginata]|uniref:Uncharacterized protein n=1 Tax=Elysia marginata TaxID=1093978 RepID=A0AAV4HK71_9GAST|nr:hypothetical protein ElyMa_001002500 [Elysia marginata]